MPGRSGASDPSCGTRNVRYNPPPGKFSTRKFAIDRAEGYTKEFYPIRGGGVRASFREGNDTSKESMTQ